MKYNTATMDDELVENKPLVDYGKQVTERQPELRKEIECTLPQSIPQFNPEESEKPRS